MNETPEAVRERVKQEELAKGSDPRVAESRSKAAEARARHGLPIDPQLAWKAKLEQEGAGGRPAAEEAAPATTTAAPEAGPDAPPDAAPDVGGETAEPRAPVPPATGDAPPAPAPVPTATATAAPAATVPVGAPQTVGISALVADLPDPEIGELIEAPEVDTVYVGGGIRARNAGIPAWLIAVMAAIVAWAVMYLVVFGTSNPIRETTGCIVQADATFTCFNPKTTDEGEGSGADH